MSRRSGWFARLGRALGDRETRGRWLVIAVIGAVLAAATFAFAIGDDGQGRPVARPYADAPYYYVYAPSILLDHDVDFTDEYRETKNWYRLSMTPSRKPSNVFGVGPALLAAPAFLTGHAIAVASGERTDGFSTVEQILTMWVSVLLAVLALVFPYRLAARRLDAPGAGLVAAVLVFAAGPVVYYAVRQPGYAHGFATFFAAWFCDAWDGSYQRERRARTWALLGLTFGLAVLARPQLATWGFLLALAGLDDLRRRRAPVRALVGRWALGAIIAVLCVAPQLLTWKALYGAYYVVPQGPGFMRWDAPAWSEVLFSSRNGLLPWAPLYAVAGLGLGAGLVRVPRVAGALLVGVALQAWANGAAWDWWGGGSFGGRRFDSTYVAFGFGLAVVLAPLTRALARVRLRPLALAGALVATAGLAAATALAIANLVMVARVASPSARIGGGDSAARVITAGVKGRLGRFAGRAAGLANWPARAHFAWTFGRSQADYDRIVGVHWLGETYPGLNSFQPKTEEHRTIPQVPALLRRGIVGGAGGVHRIPSGQARIVIPLNRTGGLRIAVTLAHPDGGAVVLAWNRAPGAPAAVTAAPAPVELTTRLLERGVNLLDIDASPGTLISGIDLWALPP